jgi:hypothetical protein
MHRAVARLRASDSTERGTRVGWALGLLCACWGLAACFRAPAVDEVAHPAPSSSDAPPAQATPASRPDEAAAGSGDTARSAWDQPPAPDHRACGVCYAHNWQFDGARGYGSETSRESLRELWNSGIRSISLTNFAWMRTLQDPGVQFGDSPVGSERFDRMIADARFAHELGMTVVFKPHLWVHAGAWQGHAAPPDWPAWFASYGAYVVETARIAESVNADWFVVGTELVTASRGCPDCMRGLIAEVRTVYTGRLTYAANWDEAEHVTFWDALDAIGVQMYAPLVDEGVTDGAATLAGAARWLARYEALSVQWDRPLLLTEVGFINREGTATAPHLWPEHGAWQATEAGDAQQRHAYEAILQTFGASPRVWGIWWWKWFTDPETDEEGATGFSPRGRVAWQAIEEQCRAVP